MNKKQQILEAVADAEQIRVDYLLSDARYANVARKRQLLMMALRYAGYSLEIIGQFIHRNHTTICHGCEKLTDADRLKARMIVESLGYPTYQPPKKFEKYPVYWRKPLPKLVVKPEPVRPMVQVLVPDYKKSICKLVWREI